MFLLDTNVVSELRKAKSGKANASVIAWASGVPKGSMYLSAITVLELELGIQQVERRDPNSGGILRAWLCNQVIPEFQQRIFPVDLAVAQRCAALHVPITRSERDALVAATALVHRMTVVTRDVSDFAPTGVPLLNPWSSP